MMCVSQGFINQKEIMKMNIENIPNAIKEYPQWVYWRYGINKRGKRIKELFNPTNGMSSKIKDQDTLGTFEDAVDRLQKDKRFHMGFVFTPYNPFGGIHLHNCRDRKTKEVASWAREIVSKMYSYTEITLSGKGLHIIAIMNSFPNKWRKNIKITFHADHMMFPITGHHLEETPVIIKERRTEARCLYCDIGDIEIQRRILQSKDAEKFIRLSAGHWQTFYDNKAIASKALCKLLAKYTQDVDQIDSIFRKSALMADKWDERHTVDGRSYGEAIIESAMKEWRGEDLDKVTLRYF